MSAYPETLLPNARSQLADAADYAVEDLGVDIDDFFAFFAASDWARRMERGDRPTILGVSGIELAQNVMSEKAGTRDFKAARESLRRTKAYWTGWVLAYYQWLSCRSFAYMLKKGLGINKVVAMYYPLHEADLSKFADAADDIIERNRT